MYSNLFIEKGSEEDNDNDYVYLGKKIKSM